MDQPAAAPGHHAAHAAAGLLHQLKALAGPRASGLTLQTELSASDSEMPDDSIVMVLHVAHGRLEELQGSHLAKLEGVVAMQQLNDGLTQCVGGAPGLCWVWGVAVTVALGGHLLGVLCGEVGRCRRGALGAVHVRAC